MLHRIDLPRDLDTGEVPPEIRATIESAKCRIQAFQDCWRRTQIEQFVAADYTLVYQTLAWIRQQLLPDGGRFLEWGSGFAVVAVLAWELGFDAIGVEAEPELMRQGLDTIAGRFAAGQPRPQLIRGNFLPHHAESLADDPTLPSLGHDESSVYETLGLDLDDFAMIYSYPWPGEDGFHEQVFERYARPGAIHVQFCGPHDIRVYQRG